MAIERRWINWATAISCAILLVFCLAEAALCLYLNLITQNLAKRAATGATLVSLGALIFPSTWIGFSAAISRHRGVYIALTIMLALSVLDMIGSITHQSYIFNQYAGFTDDERAFGITIVVMQSLIGIVLFMALGFSCAALCYNQGRHERKYYGSHPRSPPDYYSRSNEGYRMSMPPPGPWEMERYERPAPERVYYSKGRY